MKNSKVGDRVKTYAHEEEGEFLVGTIRVVNDNRIISVDWDDGIPADFHESLLIRLVPKKRVSRKELADFWDDNMWGKKIISHVQNTLFESLCDLVGAK